MLLGVLLVPLVLVKSSETQGVDKYPRLANYYLSWELSEATVQELAKWDLVVLDMEVGETNPERVRELRQLNPNIKILVYITAQEIRKDAAQSTSIMRRRLAARLPEAAYVHDTSGNRMSYWPGAQLLNMADNAPVIGGQRPNSIMAKFVAKDLLATGLWDGVFFDNAWDGLTWFTHEADLDGSGGGNRDIDTHWQNGMKFLFNETRRLSGDKYLLVGNGGNRTYRDELNGLMLENFPSSGGWTGTMQLYQFYENGSRAPRMLIINRNSGNTGRQDDYRSMRYGLGSTLLGNGYYSYDYGDQNHAQTWWYDEYNVKLGTPTGPAQSAGGSTAYHDDVWRRDYTSGVVVVNATGDTKQVDLGGEYEKIIGQQDPTVNDGSIVSDITLAPHDSVVLLKTFKTIQDALFLNGGFIRFYRLNGQRARNGFFTFEDGVAGGAQVFEGDLNDDGLNEKIVATGPRLEIFNSAGEHWFNDMPFASGFNGPISLAVGKLFDKNASIIAAPASGGGKTLLFNYHGGLVKDTVFPFGKKYHGSLSVAIGSYTGNKPSSGMVIFAGSGIGRQPAEVLVYNNSMSKLVRRFIPFKNFRGTLTVAVGDFTGNGRTEIVVAQSGVARPSVAVFTQSGKRLATFTLQSILDAQDIHLAAVADAAAGAQDIAVISSH